jgi:hypothetical protein
MDSMQTNDSPSEGSLEPSEEMATQIQDEQHFSNEKSITDNQNITEDQDNTENQNVANNKSTTDNQIITDNQIRNAVQSILTGESLKWTMKQWRENIMNILNISSDMNMSITDSDTKERLKAIVHEEGFKYVKNNPDSQTEEDGDDDGSGDVIGDNGDADDEMDVLDESTQRQDEIEDKDETEQQAAGEEVGELGGEGGDENNNPNASGNTQRQVTFLFFSCSYCHSYSDSIYWSV